MAVSSVLNRDPRLSHEASPASQMGLDAAYGDAPIYPPLAQAAGKGTWGRFCGYAPWNCALRLIPHGPLSVPGSDVSIIFFSPSGAFPRSPNRGVSGVSLFLISTKQVQTPVPSGRGVCTRPYKFKL